MIEKRIPKEEVTGFQAWSAPVLDASGVPLPSHEKQLKDGKGESIQHLSAYVQHGRLTSDVLEKLHQQIVEEGMAKGQAEGYKVGHEQGFQKGQGSGYQAGYQEGKQKAEQEAARLRELFERLFNPLQDQQARVEQWMLGSIKDICVGVMQHECNMEPELVMPFIREAVESLCAGSKNISIRLHPDDLALVNMFVQQKSLAWNLVPDAELMRGDCVVATDEALVDYTLSARVDQALIALTANKEKDAPDVVFHH